MAALTDEFADILQMLLEHRIDDDESTAWIAYAVASGCLGKDHLYSDMGLPERHMLNSLMQCYFPSLHALNPDSSMKWKKFFYKQLCDRAEIKLCPAPGCQQCIDRPQCFVVEARSGD